MPTDGFLLPDTLQEAAVDILTDAQASDAWGEEYNGDVHICVHDLEDFSSGACNVRSLFYQLLICDMCRYFVLLFHDRSFTYKLCSLVIILFLDY